MKQQEVKFTYISAWKQTSEYKWASWERASVCLYVQQTRVVDPNPLNALLFVLIGDFFPPLFSFLSPNCHEGTNPARFRASYWRQTINHWQISMAEMRTRVPYLLGLAGEPASACASSPAAPLTLNYLAAVTTNQSNYRSRTVCSCSYCTASCISFEMYEVYILSLLFI